jgi:hypothetical protein
MFIVFLFLVGVAFPFLVVTYVSDYHSSDLKIMHYWADCLATYSRKIYLECKRINAYAPQPIYTAPGLIFSAGAIHAIKSNLGGIAENTSIALFRYYLAFFEVLNFLLITWLAKLMQFRFPVVIGMLLLIVPSTWSGTSVWGQIDGISLFFCLLSIICFFKSWLLSNVKEASHKKNNAGLWLCIGTASLSIYILMKQISIFSLPFFSLLILITVWKFWKNRRYEGLAWIFLSGLIFLAFFRFFDSLFEVPEQFYNSSFWSTWSEWGSKQAKIISGNGFNIWMFLISGKGLESSIKMGTTSDITFSNLDIGSLQLNLTPYKVGILLYLFLMIFLLSTCLKIIWQFFKSSLDKNPSLNIYLMAFLLAFLGLSHLGFNVFLTGTKERYLHLGYPFMLIAILWFYTNKIEVSRFSTFFGFIAATAYGFFVYSIHGSLPGLFFPLKQHQFIASIHLFLLFLLLDLWVQLSANANNDQFLKIVNKEKNRRFQEN